MAILKIILDGGIKSEHTLDPEKEYTLGRGSQCDIVLSHSKISRQHIKIYFENGKWKCRIVSKFGQILVNGTPMEEVEFTDQLKVKIDPFEIEFTDDVRPNSRPSLFDGTQVSSFNLIATFNKISSDGSVIKSIKLDSGSFVAGRSSSCNLILEDTHASRRHFSIEFDGHKHFVKDLDSANKTYVNGKRIHEHELQSGDEVTVGDERFRFELSDPNYENLPAVEEQKFENNQPVSGSPAVIKYTADGKPLNSAHFNLLVQNIKKMNNGAIKGTLFVGAVLLIIYGALSQDNPSSSSRTVASPGGGISASPYDRLPPEQKKYIDETYNLALNLYTTGKYDLAAIEVGKIIQIVGTYKDAKNIQALCHQALEIKKQQDEADREERDQLSLKQKVADILDHCEALIRSKEYGDVEGCVSKVTEMDPDNERAQSLTLMAKQNMEDIAETKERKAESVRRHNFIVSTYNKAKEDTAAKRYPAALSKLEIVEKDPGADSAGLKQKAKDDISKLKDQMLKESKVLLDQAKASLDAKEYRAALSKFSQAITLAPFNTEARTLREKAANEIHQEMKNIYSESVIEENLGNIDSAKAKWAKIVSDDENSDPYYQKAQLKLRKYEK